MWIQVFKTGSHTASDGRKVTVDEGDLDKMVSKYNPLEHEAPVVIGHPKENHPAFGWVETLKREGNTLFAKLKQLVPEFVEMLKKGLFKKRSISIYPDYTLRHVGFLGAIPPAIKGLADIKFKEGDKPMTIEFSASGRNVDRNGNAGKALDQKIQELLQNPPKRDLYGRPRSEPLTFSEAFIIVMEENPALANEYAEEVGR